MIAFITNLLAVSMEKSEIIGLLVSILGLTIFSVVFTFLYRAYTKADIKEINEGKRDIELIDEDIRKLQPKYIKRAKVGKIVRNVLFYLFMALFIPIIIISIISRVQGNYFMIGNKGLIAVGSGSMSIKNSFNSYLYSAELGKQYVLDNQFNTYDLLVIEKVNEASDLKLYDVITFVNDEGETIIHRIVRINDDGTYLTRGDSNNTTDKYHPNFSDIKGRYTNKKASGIGIVILFLNSTIGLITLFAVIYSFFMLDFFGKKSNKARAERMKKLSIIFNPERNDTVIDSPIYYKDCKYIYEDNKFVRKEDIQLGSIRKEAAIQPQMTDKEGNLIPIDIEYFDPKYQSLDETKKEIDTPQVSEE